MFFSCISIWHSADSDAERLLGQVIAQAWNTWQSNHLEHKRLASILAKVAFRWMNGVSTRVLFMHQYFVRDDSDAERLLAGHCTSLEHLEI